MQKIKAGIIGAAGYTGGELLRLLINHPQVQVEFAQSRSNAGNLLSKLHADLAGDTDLVFSPGHHFDIDILFLCAGHGEARKFLEQSGVPATVKIIDIGNDFRLQKDAAIKGRKFIYGLPELNRDAIRKANNIANPGCFATTIQLGLLPLAKAGLLSNIYTTGITGSTGAGQSLSETSHFSWRANNIQAYKTLTHQHLGEIGESLFQLQQKQVELNFVPWRGDFTRGIFISSQLKYNGSKEELSELYRDYYAAHPFVVISNDAISMKQVVNTNKCLLQLELVDGNLVVHSVTDNLLKGASGQAVQNMNLMFGLEETAGLKLKANYY
ncbi:MAG: N-acetyl-gamma-glutamyl-phosphate reductase [Ferruginibacter sp.]